MVSAPLKARGVVVMLHPERLRAKLGIDQNTEVGLGGDGQLVLRIPGGLLGGSRVLEIERGELTISRGVDGLTIAGGPVAELVVRTDPASAVHRTWMERAPFGLGPDWSLIGAGTVQVLLLDPSDPRKPSRAGPLGRPRTTATVWRRTDGTLRLDAVQDVVELLPERVHAISTGGSKTAVIHTFRPGVDGWRVGYRLALGDEAPAAVGVAPDAVVAGRFVGRVGGEPIEAALAVRAGGTLHLFDPEAVLLASAPLATARFATEPRLLVLGPQLDLVADLPPDIGRWLVEGTPEDPELLEVAAPSGAGAVRARLLDGVVTLTGTNEHRIAIAELDPAALVVERDGEGGRLVLGRVSVRGGADAVARLREAVLAQGGRAVLARADLGELVTMCRALRIDRWLWLIYGPIFATDRLLTDATAEGSEEPDRRRLITEALWVTEQARAVRLRLGLAPVALPYLLGETGPSDGLRGHLREVATNLEFALSEVERAVARLDGLGVRSTPAAPSLDPAPTPLPPNAARKVLEQLQRDFTARMALERFGPQLRPAWTLLTLAAAVSASETSAWLQARLADRPAANRDLITEEILGLHSARTVGLDALPGTTVGDIVDHLRAAMGGAPDRLLALVVGQGARSEGSRSIDG